MIRILHRAPDGRIRTDLKPTDLAEVLAAGGLLWLDFEAEPAEVCEPVLRQVFAFHPLAIDDALVESHVPRVDDWGRYLYLVLPAIVLGDGAGLDVQAHELDAFLGADFLVTHHDQSLEPLDRVWTSCQRDPRHLEKAVDHVLYKIVDELAASYMSVIERIDEAIDRVEDEVFDRPTPATLERIFLLKRSLLQLRRILLPQREVLNKLARGDFAVIDAEDRVFFRDVYDHLVRMHDITESMRDLVSGTLDTYLSVINNRMNDIMKTLTVITTLFMPISFIAGFFGMNYFAPVADTSAWTDIPSLIITLTILVLLPVGMFFWIRRRGWM